MHVSQNEPAKSLTGLETVPWALESKSIEQRTLTPKSESELLAAREGRKAFQQAPNLAGFEPDLWTQDLKSSEQQNFTPKSESELLADRDSAGAREPDSPADGIGHVTHPDVSGAPASETPFHTSRSSFSGQSVATSMLLALIFGVGAGAAWALKSSLTSSAATPEQISHSPFANQLNVIAQDLSSLRQDLKGLAAHQEQLAAAQARLMAAQEQTLLKLGTAEQLKRGSPTRPASRAYR